MIEYEIFLTLLNEKNYLILKWKITKFTKARLKINPNISELAVEVFFTLLFYDFYKKKKF